MTSFHKGSVHLEGVPVPLGHNNVSGTHMPRPAEILKKLVRYVRTTSSGDRPASISAKGTPGRGIKYIIEYAEAPGSLYAAASKAAASRRSQPSMLVRVTTREGALVNVAGGRMPRDIYNPLMAAAKEPTAERAAKRFFQILRQSKKVALKEVSAKSDRNSKPKPRATKKRTSPRQVAKTRKSSPASAEKREAELATLRAAMAAQNAWDASSSSSGSDGSRKSSKSVSSSKGRVRGTRRASGKLMSPGRLEMEILRERRRMLDARDARAANLIGKAMRRYLAVPAHVPPDPLNYYELPRDYLEDEAEMAEQQRAMDALVRAEARQMRRDPSLR